MIDGYNVFRTCMKSIIMFLLYRYVMYRSLYIYFTYPDGAFLHRLSL